VDVESPPIHAFLSYAHSDDNEFEIVAPLVNKLTAFVRAKSGRALEIFVDRESIGWGTDWRESISGSVENATIFIPLLTANYLDSAACREEFLAFHSKAEVLGVTDLLLPILVFKSSLFKEGATDEIAQIAERLQYKCIEDAVLAGFQSPEWLRTTRDLSEALLAALASAEASLLEKAPPPSATSRPSGTDLKSDREVAIGASGLAEIMAEMEKSIDQMNTAAESLAPALESFGSVPVLIGDLPAEPTAKQVTVWTLHLAQEFKAPAQALEIGGRQLFEATKSLDETFVKLKQLRDFVEVPEVADNLEAGRKSLVDSFGDLREVAGTMAELLQNMKPAEVLSVPLRKALQPARRGLTAVSDSLNLIESWQEEFPEETAD
jgi:hypothetical protein